VRLSGAVSQVLQHSGQQVAVRITRCQVHSYAAAGIPDAGPDLQELQPQGIDLSSFQIRALQVPTQQPEQAVGGGVQEQAELIVQKTVAAQAVGLDLQLQFFNAVFHVAPQHVDLVIDELGVANQVSDQEELIGTQSVVLQLGDDAAGPGPGLRIVAEGGEGPLPLPRSLVGSLGFLQEWRGLFHDPGCWLMKLIT
jgi:hypothetical protein